MNSLELNENICRICLKGKIKFNWNDYIFEFSGISYKDCYFKYTKLDDWDALCYPTNLCEKCATDLKNAHKLFERALESFKILQAVFRPEKIKNNCSNEDICSTSPVMKCEIKVLDEGLKDYKSLIQIKNEGCLSPVRDTTEIETENIVNNSHEIITDEDLTIQTIDFLDIQKLCTTEIVETENIVNNSPEIITKENSTIEPIDFLDIQKLSTTISSEERDSAIFKKKTKKRGNKRKKNKTLKLCKYRDTEQSKSPTKKRTGRRTLCESKSQTVVQDIESHDTVVSISSDNEKVMSPMETVNQCGVTKPIVPTSKPKTSRDKYIFMCSYCSLKVNGVDKLERHEATHTGNRKRTETCPHCGIKLYTKTGLNEHMRIHDKNRVKSHKCDFCEKAFFYKGTLNVHRRVHLDLMVKCQICCKEFYRQVDLDNHLLSHSASPASQRYAGKKKYAAPCEYCGKSILTIKYKGHIAAHLNQPQMKCKICDKEFFARSNCTDHLRRFHLKKSSEYDDFIQYYVDRKERVSILQMKQQLSAQPLTE